MFDQVLLCSCRQKTAIAGFCREYALYFPGNWWCRAAYDVECQFGKNEKHEDVAQLNKIKQLNVAVILE